MCDAVLADKIYSFNHENSRSRVIYKSGAGAHGFFELNEDQSGYTRAQFLNGIKGKKTPVFVRFSSQGESDFDRNLRGFSIKFYTEDGNYDLIGSNQPVYYIKDPMKMPDLMHAQGRNP